MAAETTETALVTQIGQWARELGFSQIGVAGIDLSDAEAGLMAWLEKGFHGEMEYMQRHGLKRARPAELVPGTLSIVTARMDYLPPGTPTDWQGTELAQLGVPERAVVSMYARGRDYHKVLRTRLQRLAERIQAAVGPLGHRVFTDSAPVLEAELARRSGLGWRGKHTLLLSREGGSMFFLGEIFLDMALPPTEPTSSHCGGCRACIAACPTGAIVASGRVDARLCISYLTIEHPGSIPLALRPLMGNRIYGCDDCQLVCPWNKFAQPSTVADFAARPALQSPALLELLGWSEADFLQRTEGSPMRRIGYLRWQRNLAVASGNALHGGHLSAALAAQVRAMLERWRAAPHTPELVREHVDWALASQVAHGLAFTAPGSAPRSPAGAAAPPAS
ncbi:tRNA epoxyqueuosine(34) reductase QueG [Corticibacter populi]|uniref:tRNA epoxyqueuosine(34) reductase QueG n=1 Tax=Corticibacter populi TaxID=1550736 RepID=UPI001A91B8AF|nr:tRNA epoxyqueuosine(34) reductase QueG [Corticibacter populi]